MKENEYAKAAALIASELEKRLQEMKVTLPPDIHLFALANAFIALWADMNKAVTSAKKNHPVDREFLQLAAHEIASRLPDQWGFMLLCTETNTPDGRMTYTANMDRKDCVAMLKEWLLKVSPEEWLKHVE